MKKLSLTEIKAILGANDNDTTLKTKVTPEIAKKLLRRCNKQNRRVNMRYVNTYKRDMEAGHWYSDIDYIGFNKEGTLVNGQHRLKALAIADVDNIELKFDFDVDQHISMDTGNIRKYTDQVSISKKAGIEIMPNKFKPIINAGLKLNDSKINLSNTELSEIWDKYSNQILECDKNELFDLGKISGATIKSSLLWAYLSGIDMEFLHHFAEVLRTGINEGKKDIPIIRLRDELVDMKGSSKALDLRRAELTQHYIYLMLQGYDSNRLPSAPHLHYQDINIL